MASNFNRAVTQLAELGGGTNSGIKIGWIEKVPKTAIDDTVTVTNATTILYAVITNEEMGGALLPHTISSNVVTLNGAVTAAISTASLVVVYR